MRLPPEEKLEALTRGRRTLGFDFLQPPRTGRVVLEAEGIELSAGDKRLLESATMVVERGEKVALVGPNGSGKTTLIETLLGLRAATGGKLGLGHGVIPAYFSQHTQAASRRGIGARLRTPGDGPVAASGADPARPLPLFRAGRCTSARSPRCPEASAGGSRSRPRRVGRELPRPRRADQPPRSREPRGARGSPRGIPGDGAHRLARPRAARRGPRSIVAVEERGLRSYDGGWADLKAERSADAAPPPQP